MACCTLIPACASRFRCSSRFSGSTMCVALSPLSKPSLKNERSTLCSSSMLLRSEEHTPELQTHFTPECRDLLATIFHLTRVVNIRTGISHLGRPAFSSPCLRSCEPVVAPLSRGGTGPVERRTGSPEECRR